MAENTVTWSPTLGDYVWVQRKRAKLAAGRVTRIPRPGLVSVRLTSGTYVTMSGDCVFEHPQNHWGH